MQLRSYLAALPLAAVLAVTGVSSTGASLPAQSPAGTIHAVGTLTLSITDGSRSTSANGDCPKISSRTLVTTVFYPATGDTGSAPPQDGAEPDHSGAPYPLIVFSHGFGANPALYGTLLAHWAAAGYVVAAPLFPLSSSESPCGATAGDVVNQPQDVSAVISAILKSSARRGSELAGLVDPHEVGAAGHSNGGITTYGVVANSAVRDRRVKAAAILAGTAEEYPKGHYDFTKSPPLLFVHGTDDELVSYDSAISGFNRARGPKGLLTIVGGGHGSAGALTEPAVQPVLQATTDFFDAYLRDDTAAKTRLPDDQVPGVTTMRFVPEPGSTTTIPTLARPKLNLRAKVTPTKNLKGGQMVTVTWNGYTAGKVINILQCSADDRDLTNSGACDFTHAYLLQPDPTGAGSTMLQIVEGAVGTGTCDAKHQGCFIVVNNASSTEREQSVVIPITFAR